LAGVTASFLSRSLQLAMTCLPRVRLIFSPTTDLRHSFRILASASSFFDWARFTIRAFRVAMSSASRASVDTGSRT
jgi:hypothetical protein